MTVLAPSPVPFVLVRSIDGAPPVQKTTGTLRWDAFALELRAECADTEIRATRTGRDEPLWEEEVVELFVASGTRDPKSYFEFQVNPLGALFDARVANPDGRRATMVVDPTWDCDGVVHAARVERRAAVWTARLRIPWRSLDLDGPPSALRLNVYRIDRPVGGEAEFSAWFPTRVDPPDFHVPAAFGTIRLVPA